MFQYVLAINKNIIKYNNSVLMAARKGYSLYIYTVGHKKRATSFSAITPTFLCQFLHFL